MSHENDVPPPSPPPPPPGLVARLRHRHRTLSLSNRLGFYALVLTAAGLAAQLLTAVWTATTGPGVGLLVDQTDDTCSSVWAVPPGSEELVDQIHDGTEERQLARWEHDRRLVHRDMVRAEVSVRSGELPIEIRDVSITVLSRAAPVAGGQAGPGGCGGEQPEDEPDFIVVDLDTLPVGGEVPVTYLQQSDQQGAARAEVDDLGEQITLPRTVGAADFYSFTLIGRSAAYDIEWQATITWWDGEQVHTDVVDDDGKPFRVTAPG